MKSILRDGKALILAYDQGMEHGPVDFNLKNINPDYIIDIAEKGDYNALAVQSGIAEKYRTKVPLIIKLNGKTNIAGGEPISRQVCSVRRAIKLDASAVGYTIYLGSEFESEMFAEFGRIVEEARSYKLPVIAWMYPRGKAVINDKSTEILAYAARAGLELGADFVKIKYNDDLEGFKWVVKAAGKTKVIMAGGEKVSDEEFLQRVHDVILAGACGVAVGRNVWQHEQPLKMTNAIKKIVFEGKKVDQAMK